jgi:hypothetical protein
MMRVQNWQGIRADERRPFQGSVLVSWQGPSGEVKTIRAKCLDISDLGARIECEPAIDSRTNVFVEAPAHGLLGNASVRYCRRSGMKHIIGLMFSAPASQADEGRKRLIRSVQNAEK